MVIRMKNPDILEKLAAGLVISVIPIILHRVDQKGIWEEVEHDVCPVVIDKGDPKSSGAFVVDLGNRIQLSCVVTRDGCRCFSSTYMVNSIPSEYPGRIKHRLWGRKKANRIESRTRKEQDNTKQIPGNGHCNCAFHIP